MDLQMVFSRNLMKIWVNLNMFNTLMCSVGSFLKLFFMFDLMLYVPVNNFFSYVGVEPVLSKD